MHRSVAFRWMVSASALFALTGWLACSSSSDDDDDDDEECSSDSDCKGDRVCDDGECVDPSGPTGTSSGTSGGCATLGDDCSTSSCCGSLVCAESVCTEPSGTSTSGSSSTSTSTATGMPAGCELPGTSAPSNCAAACSILYDCGALTCSGQQVCPGFDGSSAQKATFVEGCTTSCNSQQALISLVDPSSCDGTVETLSAVNAQFADTCQNGL
jgi:hypothetical protein